MSPTVDLPGLLLGVDVGNSKTDVAVATRAGDVLATVTGPGASPQTLGAHGSWKLITQLTDAALQRADRRRREILGAAYAVAGLDFDDEIEAFRACAPPDVPPLNLILNDTFAVLRSATARDGIAVVAGAGLNCVGVCAGATARLPGLGALSGDWGGGIVLGREALSAACRSADGRGPRTALEFEVPGLFKLPTAADVTIAVHRRVVPDTALTALAALVLHGADACDEVCVTLIRRQADEVVGLVGAVTRQFTHPPDDLPIVLGGGLLQAGCRALNERINLGLRRRWPDARIVTANSPPVHGALLLAADLTTHAADNPTYTY